MKVKLKWEQIGENIWLGVPVYEREEGDDPPCDWTGQLSGVTLVARPLTQEQLQMLGKKLGLSAPSSD